MATMSVLSLNVQVGSTYLDVVLEGSSLNFDTGRLPYIQGTIVIARPTPAVLAMLDPTTRPTLTVIGYTMVDGAGYGGTFYGRLDLIGRAGALTDDTITLTVVSPDQRLSEFRSLATTPVNLVSTQTSVADLAAFVIAYAGITTALVRRADATFQTFTAESNVVLSGSFEGLPQYVNWYAPDVIGTYDTGWSKVGSKSFKLVPTGTNDSYVEAPLDEVSGPKQYTFRGTIYLPAAQTGALSGRARTIALVANTKGADRVLATSTPAPNRGGATDLELNVFVPKGATNVHLRLYNGAGSGGGAVYWDAVSGFEGDGLEANGTKIPYFDYDTPDTNAYVYTATSGNSGLEGATSTRTPVIDRSPDTLMWQQGQTAWDFIAPILTATGLRLYANESGFFYIDRALQPAPGTIAVTAGGNLYDYTTERARDLQAFDGSPLFFDALSIKYTWIDYLGNSREAWDVYAPAGWSIAHQLEYNRPYPGPGAAQKIVQSVANRKDSTTVLARLDCSNQPGMPATVVLDPGGATLHGSASSVAWDFGAAEMTLEFRNLA